VTGGARRSAAAAALSAAACLLLPAGRLGAQDLTCQRGDREVRTLRFAGNRAFDAVELGSVVVTTPSDFVSRLRFLGTRRCLNPDEFARDVLRLAAYYRKRGYPDAAVDTVVRPLGRGGPNPPVAVTFGVREGEPLRIDSLTVLGLDSVRDARRVRAAVRLRPGDVFDRAALEAAHDSVRLRLRDAGYPAADALFSWSTDLRRRTAVATITAVPGRFTRVGEVVLEREGARGGPPRVPERVVRRTSGLRPGDPVRAGDLLAAQRALYQTDAFAASTCSSTPRPAARAPTRSPPCACAWSRATCAPRASRRGGPRSTASACAATTPTATSCRARSGSSSPAAWPASAWATRRASPASSSAPATPGATSTATPSTTTSARRSASRRSSASTACRA
jgi:hypothetical protein